MAHGGFGIERGEIAELFGLEPDALRDLLQDGQSLADVATAQGVDVQTVIDTLVNAAKEHLDEAVTNGRLTQEEADAKLVEITERITEMVNTARPPPTTDPSATSSGLPSLSTPEKFEQPRTESSPQGADRPRSTPCPGGPGPSAVIAERRP